MNGNNQEKVYLLPHTIGYFQQELTRLLEFERYAEAVEMLRFLLSCETGDAQSVEEWQSLLGWMLAMLPELQTVEPDEEEQSEEDLLRIHMKEKTAREPEYVEKLLEVFRRPGGWDKQVLALEQLRYLKHPRIPEVLLKWLQRWPLPPMLQFRAMQILKQRGESATVKLRKNGKIYKVDIRDVPAGPGDYPPPVQDILQRVLNSQLRDGMPLHEFAGDTWSEFVAYAFGTPLYLEILVEPYEMRDAWAAAFHYILLMTAQGTASADEIKDLYGITGSMEQKWSKAVGVFADFAKTVFPSLT